MRELLIPADPEEAVVNGLRGPVTAPVGTRMPKNPLPASFGRVIASGGVQQSLVHDRFTVTLEGFGETETAARNLCARMIGAAQASVLTGALGGFTCYGVQVLALPANDPLPTLPTRYRYSATITIDLRRVDG